MIPANVVAAIGNGASIGLDFSSKKAEGQAAILKGKRSQVASEFEAKQLEQNAGQAIAASQRNAEDVRRQARMISSRALALAASSGGGASDPTVINLIAKTQAEGAYRRAVALYQGQEKARLLNLQAMTRRVEGEQAMQDAQYAKKASDFSAFASLAKGGASLYSRFALDRPTAMPVDTESYSFDGAAGF